MIVSKVGARSGRTDDLDLEMRRKWWAQQDLNLRPIDYELGHSAPFRRPESRRYSRGVVLHCTLCVTRRGDAMNDTTFTFRVDEELKADFVNIAKARDRTAAQLLRD